jgi:hypothetical protein
VVRNQTRSQSSRFEIEAEIEIGIGIGIEMQMRLVMHWNSVVAGRPTVNLMQGRTAAAGTGTAVHY